MKRPGGMRSQRRYGVSIPAMMRDAGGKVLATGLVENISASGALLARATKGVEVGTTGRLRLMNLSETLRIPSQETIELEAEVVRNANAGFALRFLGATRVLEKLLERAMGRGGIAPTD